jgi:hypothetical protein
LYKDYEKVRGVNEFLFIGFDIRYVRIPEDTQTTRQEETIKRHGEL